MATQQDREQMIADIKKILIEYDYDYVPIGDDESLQKIHNFMCNNIFEEPKTAEEYAYFGRIYQINKNYRKAKNYYLLAIENGDISANVCLGDYHWNMEKSELAEYYYIQAMNRGDVSAITRLGDYYYEEEDYEKTKVYYMMAIERGNTTAMNNLGHYHEHITKDYDQMKKYYDMAIERGNPYAMNNLIDYYTDHGIFNPQLKLFFNQKQFDKFIELLSRCLVQPGHLNELDEELINMIINIDLTTITGCPTYLVLLQNTMKLKLDILALHFNYSLEGKGFAEAKSDFIDQIIA